MAVSIIMQVLNSLGYEPMYPFNPSLCLNATVIDTSTALNYNLLITGVETPITADIGNKLGIISFLPTVNNASGAKISINGDIALSILMADGSAIPANTFTTTQPVFVKYYNGHFVLLLNKNQVGLNNVDNTSDINKPISTAVQNALNNKLNIPTSIPRNANLNNYQTAGLYYNPSDADSATITNVPVANAFSLFVERHAGVKQTFTAYGTSGMRVWSRNYYSGTWGSWSQEAFVYSGTSTPSSSLGVNGNIYVKIG